MFGRHEQNTERYRSNFCACQLRPLTFNSVGDFSHFCRSIVGLGSWSRFRSGSVSTSMVFFVFMYYPTLLRLPPLGFHCVGGCLDRLWHWQSNALTTRLSSSRMSYFWIKFPLWHHANSQFKKTTFIEGAKVVAVILTISKLVLNHR
jgi:hypothetical protein